MKRQQVLDESADDHKRNDLKKLFIYLFIMGYPLTALASALGWKGEVELGFVSTKGNTETQSISAKSDINDERKNWRHHFHTEALNASAEGVRSAERYNISGQSNYKFNNFDSILVVVNLDDDRFSAYDYQVSIAAGYARRFVDRNDQILDFEIGPGYRINTLDNNTSTEESMVRVAAKYILPLSKTSRFQQSLVSEIGEESTLTKSITSVKAQINGSLAMKTTLTLKNNSYVPAGAKKTDTETALTLVYAF